MKSLGPSCYAITAGVAAALLSGCGGSQSPIARRRSQAAATPPRRPVKLALFSWDYLAKFTDCGREHFPFLLLLAVYVLRHLASASSRTRP